MNYKKLGREAVYALRLCDALPAKYIKNFTTVTEFETGA